MILNCKRCWVDHVYLSFCRINQRQRKPESALQTSTYLTPQAGTDHLFHVATHQTKQGKCGSNGSSALYENDNKAYVNIKDTATVSEYAGLEQTNEYSNTAHIYSDLKWTTQLYLLKYNWKMYDVSQLCIYIAKTLFCLFAVQGFWVNHVF